VIVQAVTSPEAQWLRGVLEASHAGSWRDLPVRQWSGRRRAGLLPTGEGLDHDHLPPQQGHGGRVSGASSGTLSSGGGAAASSLRASARLSLWVPPASKP
jgi:hypothetical protein